VAERGRGQRVHVAGEGPLVERVPLGRGGPRRGEHLGRVPHRFAQERERTGGLLVEVACQQGGEARGHVVARRETGRGRLGPDRPRDLDPLLDEHVDHAPLHPVRQHRGDEVCELGPVAGEGGLVLGRGTSVPGGDVGRLLGHAPSVPVHRIEPGPGQESVWDYPRPPRLEPTSSHLVVRVAGVTVAETRRGHRVLETSQPPAFYFPPEDVDLTLLRPSSHRTWCEWKGVAHYVDVVVGDRVVPEAAWRYD